MSAISASGLVKRFGSIAAVDDVSIELPPGQVRGLLGANGAGKTTLLRLLLGLIAPDAGTIQLLDRPLEGPGSAALDHVGGFVEEPSFYPYLSGRANLEALAALDGWARSSARGLIAEALDRVGLADQADVRFGGYSTGMRQRLGIAAALLRAPRILLLDEPTSGLDPGGARTVAELLRELAADGVAVLLSSHQVGELEKVCDAYAFMRRGRIVWSGDIRALRDAAPAASYALQTSDDLRARRLASERADVQVQVGPASAVGLTLTAGEAALDGFVIALGREAIAVRGLREVLSPLESMFFALAEDTEPTARVAA